MSPRTRWWLRSSGSAIVWAAVGVWFAIVGERAAAIVAIGAAFYMAIQVRVAVLIYRRGFWRGRLSILSNPRPVSEDQNPWDAVPPLPEAMR